MTPDPRWLEILKASGPQLLGLAAALGIFLLVERWEWIPALPDWAAQLSVLAFLVTAGLWVMSVVAAALKFFPPKAWLLHWRRRWRDRRETRNYIPHMTEQERGIIAYLLAHNQKMFTGDAEGGHAVTLVSRGIVVRAMVPGQQAVYHDVPFGIPDHIWGVLVRHRDQFPYDPQGEDDRPYPWRVHWMG